MVPGIFAAAATMPIIILFIDLHRAAARGVPWTSAHPGRFRKSAFRRQFTACALFLDLLPLVVFAGITIIIFLRRADIRFVMCDFGINLLFKTLVKEHVFASRVHFTVLQNTHHQNRHDKAWQRKKSSKVFRLP